MEAEIPAASLKAFYRALQCLGRIGSEISFEAQSQHLELIGINASRSAYASFTFAREFFDSYSVAEATVRCRVAGRALVGMFRGRGASAAERSVLRIEQATAPVRAGAADGECRLVVQLEYREGVCRTHRLFYEACETLHPVYVKDACKGRWRVAARVAAGWVGHFARGQAELTLWMGRDEVRVRSWAEGQYASTARTQGDATPTRTLQTELAVAAAEFDTYSIGDAAAVELTFALREFRAVLQYAEAMALPISAHFDRGGAPLLLSVGADDIAAEFVLATMTEYAASQGTAPASATGTPHRELPSAGSFATPGSAPRTARRDSPQVGSFATPPPPMRDEQADSIATRSREGVSELVPSPSPYASTRASHDAWPGIGVDIDRADSLLNPPASAYSSGRQQSSQAPVHIGGVERGTGEREYRLLDMPRPQVPPGVTDSQEDSASDSLGAVAAAPPGMVQTRLPYPGRQQTHQQHSAAVVEVTNDNASTDMSSDEELGATPPPPSSKRMRSLF
ncbi:hypothetical protein COEREDRAFT_7214 [Coemansia reversa NRRL 1564]|uniref:Rad9-domain-containing protein n=1 Tax=Coemansia reversa (strain ATCC 12441 / NRRL 1564) TaxID=763665 RepID=A0A2G5BF51_COERN|nr:hypothetical protein COEREDRAFT_7214 [Coemansia reversa NRRL 1564]|eukprot:PIA17621.1 hypothetical protein COEREDRAFT_7214 [Coemansia reversa NRRL 1564]